MCTFECYSSIGAEGFYRALGFSTVEPMKLALAENLTIPGFSQFDPTIFNSIDGSNMNAVSANYFHMLFDFARVGHRLTSG